MPNRNTYYDRLMQRWKNNRLIALGVFLAISLISLISGFDKISSFFDNIVNPPKVVFSESVTFSYDSDSLLVSFTVVNPTESVLSIQEDMGCVVYQTPEGLEIISSTLQDLRERFVRDGEDIISMPLDHGILGISVATLTLGKDLVAPGEKELVTFRIDMPPQHSKDFTISAHEFVVGCEFWVGRGEEARRIGLLPRYSDAPY